MIRGVGIFSVGAACMICACARPAVAVTINGVVPVSITSDTAAAAKNMAFDEARRQVLMNGLRQYADVEQLTSAIGAASADDLTNLIAASGIDGERVSDTTYSANISMTVDIAAARRWMNANSVQNWLPDRDGGERFITIIDFSDAVPQWMELQRIARAEHIDMATKHIAANQATVEMPASVRGAFTIAIREAGWKYTDQDGVLRIGK